MNFKEKYAPRPMAANTTATVDGVQLGGFIAVTGGTITVTNDGINYLAAAPVTAGQYLPLPMGFNVPGITITLAGGASGTLLV